jgi:hypothetical protein
MYDEEFTKIEEIKNFIDNDLYNVVRDVNNKNERNWWENKGTFDYYFIITTEEKLESFIKTVNLTLFIPIIPIEKVRYFCDISHININTEKEIYNGFHISQLLLFSQVIENEKRKTCLTIIDFTKYFNDSEIYKKIKVLESKKVMEKKMDPDDYNHKEASLREEIF